MQVTKADGTKEDFSSDKIVQTCLRAGVDKKAALEIAAAVQTHIRDGAATHEIYHLIVNELDKREDKSSLLFRLREVVAKLDSRSFELYVKKLLTAAGYECEWNQKIKGLYTEHQVDVVARNSEGVFLVECKRHVNPHRYTGLNIPLQVQARIEDVNEKGRVFDGAWIVTNGKFSEHAKDYAKGRGIRLTGWKYQKGLELEALIHKNSMYPVTMLKIDENSAKTLLSAGVITVQDFLKSDFCRKDTFKNAGEQAEALTKAAVRA